MPWLPLLLSLVPVLWGAQMVTEMRLAHRLRRVGVEVAGRVVRRRPLRGIDHFHYAPVVRFTTPAGQVVTAESAGHAIGLRFRTGDAVRLRYDPAEPTRFLLAAEWGNGSRYARLGIAGALLAGLWRWG
ncbi:DUF3592 domain-containing protein [Hymenobacter ruricola]|uniref:DUF3592 domain-containing protein n=1 Tax=Hymenobacter ruricola TaxID=2791023 RepID=A0ABS0I7S1_9BACT|nr:DUF3592 domain-containing protein [Hymenobacter ruricola]MBF9223013.1 DUF3592 domain-containing protein [Hymenobacter ruricola]